MELYKLIAIISASLVTISLILFIFRDLFKDMRNLSKKDAIIENMHNRRFKVLKGKKSSKKKPVRMMNKPMLRKIK